jgi:outer membrane protein assembly factor BamA
MVPNYCFYRMILLLLAAVGVGYGQEVPAGESVPLATDTLPARTFRFLPILSYAQETSLQLGGYGLYAFSLEENDPLLTRRSHVSLTGLYTLNKQTILKAQGDVWSKGNTWHWAAEAGFRNFPFYFYGIGAQTQAKDRELLVEKRVNFYLSAERQIAGPYYAGLQLGADAYQYRSIEPAGRYQSDSTITGKRGGQLVSLGLLQVYDSRNSAVYSTRGFFARLTAGYAPKLGQENYRGSFLLADLRLFTSLSPEWTLGLQGVYQAYSAERVPFYLLPQLGNDQLMRGYYAGRYRDKYLGAAQAEIRFRPTPQLAVVGFLGTANVAGRVSLLTHPLKLSYGVGLRYFVDTRQGLSIRLDYGIGQQLPDEKRQSGFYFSLGEAF